MHPAEARKRKEEPNTYVEEVAEDADADQHLPHLMVKAGESPTLLRTCSHAERSFTEMVVVFSVFDHYGEHQGKPCTRSRM